MDLENIPICLECENASAREVLTQLGQSFSENVYLLSSEERMAVHIAAVFACNFSNAMFRISKDILEQQGLEFTKVMQLLVEETVEKAFALGPENAQTGPATRKDLGTLKAHYDFLENDSRWQEIYKSITNYILTKS